MLNTIIGIVLALIPIVYGGVLLIKVNKLSYNMTEEEREEADGKIKRMKRSGTMFLVVGLYFAYQFYSNNT